MITLSKTTINNLVNLKTFPEYSVIQFDYLGFLSNLERSFSDIIYGKNLCGEDIGFLVEVYFGEEGETSQIVEALSLFMKEIREFNKFNVDNGDENFSISFVSLEEDELKEGSLTRDKVRKINEVIQAEAEMVIFLDTPLKRREPTQKQKEAQERMSHSRKMIASPL